MYFLSGGRPRQLVPVRILRELAVEVSGLEPWLFEESYQAVGDLAETISLVLPENLPPQRAVLAANMETALNAVWDAAPGPANRIAVVGAGVVGALVAYLCGGIPGAEVTLVDINPARAESLKLKCTVPSPLS